MHDTSIYEELHAREEFLRWLVHFLAPSKAPEYLNNDAVKSWFLYHVSWMRRSSTTTKTGKMGPIIVLNDQIDSRRNDDHRRRRRRFGWEVPLMWTSYHVSPSWSVGPICPFRIVVMMRMEMKAFCLAECRKWLTLMWFPFPGRRKVCILSSSTIKMCNNTCWKNILIMF